MLQVLSGYTREEICSISDWTEKVYGEEGHVVKSHIDTLFDATSRVDEGEYSFTAKDGRALTWHFSSSPAGRLPDGRRIVISAAIDVTQRRQAEEALRESEERFELAVGATSDGIWDWNILTNDIYYSPAWCEINGYSYDDPGLLHIYDSWADRIHPDDRDHVMKALAAHLEEGAVYDVDYRHRRKSGEYHWQNARGQAIRDERGKLVRMIGCTRDITKRRQAEADLELQRHYLARAQEIGSIGTWDLDIKKNELFWTEENYRVFGVPLGTEMNYETFLNCVHPDDRLYVDEKFNAAQHHEPYDIEHRLLVDGKTKWVREKAELEFDENGLCVRATGVTQDITERKRAQAALQKAHQQLELRVKQRTSQLSMANETLSQEIVERERIEGSLRESEKNLSLIYDTIWDVLFQVKVEPEGGFRFLSVNQAFLNTTGLTEKQIVGKRLEDVIPEGSRALVRARYEEAVREKTTVTWEETSVYPSGVKTGSVALTPALNGDGICTHLIGSVHDITERKRKEEQVTRQAAVLQAINDVFRETLTCETEEELGKTCLAVAEKLTGSKFGLFLELNSRGLLDTVAISNPGWDACDMAVADARQVIKNMPVRGIDRSTVREGMSRIVDGSEMATHPDRCGASCGASCRNRFPRCSLETRGNNHRHARLGEQRIGLHSRR